MKSESPDKLTEAILHLLDGDVYVSESMRQTVLHKIQGGGPRDRTRAIDSLSDREMEVFQLIGRGYSTPEIAHMLDLSIKTIETHRSHIKKKMELPNNTALIHSAAHWVLEGRRPGP